MPTSILHGPCMATGLEARRATQGWLDGNENQEDNPDDVQRKMPEGRACAVGQLSVAIRASQNPWTLIIEDW
jgi:hypothetical protein